MVRYTVKPDQAAHNEELVRAVFTELEELQPAGLRYATLKLDDGVSFIHLVWSDNENEHLPGRQLHALKAFHAGIRDRCEDAPVRTTVSVIGSFRLFEHADPSLPTSGPGSA